MKKNYNKLAVLFCFAMFAFAGNSFAQDGCTSSTACNFDSTAVTDDGSCTFPGDACDDADATTGNDVLQADCSCAGELLGCTNAAACNFNSLAVVDDGSCDLPGDACDDGDITTSGDVFQADCSCAGIPNQGCTDPLACNFDSTAGVDDASCTYPGDACDDLDASTGNDTLQADCSCAGTAQGCTDSAALNYDSAAILDDGSCVVPGCADAPTAWTYCYDVNENAVVAVFAENNPGEGVAIEFLAGLIEVGWDVITIYDGSSNLDPVLFSGDGDLTGLLLQSTGATLAVEIVSDASVSCQAGSAGASPAISANVYCAAEVDPGCTDSTACNYDAAAGFDDGTCAFPGDACDDADAGTVNDVYDAGCACAGELLGCTDTTADNYNSLAIVDDGTCLFNDNCANPEVVACGDTVAGSNLQATPGSELLAPACGPAIEGPGVWYSIVGTGDEITVSTCNDPNGYDSRLHVFSGDCANLVCEGGNDDSDCDGDGFNELQSTVTWLGSIGVEYFIHVSGWNGAVGDFEMTVSCGPAACTPSLLNDQCGNAFPLTDGALFQGDNTCAYANDAQPSCDPFAVVNGVWYVWNSGANNAATLDFATAAAPAVNPAATAPALAMFSGNCANLTELFCDDVVLPIVGQEITGLSLATDYYFLVWTDADVNEGEFELTVTGGVAGCTTVGACNYDASASIDDGSCDLSCLGCTDPTALNFSSTAITDDGSCKVAPCADAPINTNYCYASNDNVTWTFQETTPGAGLCALVNAGFFEVGWDTFSVYDGLDNTGAVLFSGDGDVSGLLFDPTSGAITFEIVADASVSCEVTATIDPPLDFDVYCAQPYVLGCTDPLATNFNSEATQDDGSCFYGGCMDSTACNYNATATIDDGTCCFGMCVDITIDDSFGDGGPSLSLFDDMNNLLATVALADGFTISESFCIDPGCVTLVVTADAFPDETTITITSQDGVEYVDPQGSGLDGGPIVLDLGGVGGCPISGCTDPTALNYNPDATQDCLDVPGGTDFSCCIYPAANNDCDGAIALTAGVVTDWTTTEDAGLAYDGSGYDCSPTLAVDAWFSYTPSCETEVTITSTSLQGGELGVWEGDCAGGALTLVECGANGGFQATTLEVVLQGGVTYYIQTGSNSDFGANSIGTIEITEGDCRGCIYDAAENYDPLAVIDNGGCIFDCLTCAGDFNGDNNITAADLTGFLAVFGGTCD